MRLHGADRGDKAEASASLVGVSAVSHLAIGRFAIWAELESRI
jgi:hypothetical protein